MPAEPRPDGWSLLESGPREADHTVLLLPGAFCTAAFYEDVLAEPSRAQAPVRFVAATPPGFGGNPCPDDVSVEGYARLVGSLAAELGCDVLVGHSYFANVAIELAATGGFSGRLVLLSPCFSSRDEERDFRMLNRVAQVPGLGRVLFALAPMTFSSSMKGRFPEARHDDLVAEMKTSDMGVMRRTLHPYFEHMDRYGSLVSPLCDSGVRTWVVRGDRDEIGLSDEERRGLEACPNVTLLTVPDAAHFIMTDRPDRTAELLLEIVGAPTDEAQFRTR
jgi:pimeloyl-ACP methyl ester carboxylesterase